MALIDASVITSKNRSSAYTATTNNALLTNNTTLSTSSKSATTSPMSGLASSVSSIPSAISKGVTTATGGATSTVTSFISGIGSDITSAVSEVETKVTSLTSSLFSSASSLSNAFSKSVSNAFSDSSTNNATASKVKTETPDPIKSSFSSSQPRSTLVKLTSAQTGLTPQTITGSTKSTNDVTKGAIVAAKYGSELVGSTTASIKNAADSVLKSSLVSGLFSGIKTVTGTATSVESSISSIFTTVSSLPNTAISSSLSAYRDIMGDLSSSLTGAVSGLDSGLDTSLPATTDTSGAEVYGLNSSVNTGTISSLTSTMSNMGCKISTAQASQLFNYGAVSSATSTIATILSKLGLTSLLGDLLSCTSAVTKSTSSTFSSLFYQYAGSNINVSNTIISANVNKSTGLLTPEHTIGATAPLNASGFVSSPALLKSIVVNQNLTSSDLPAVKNVIGLLGSGDADAYTTTETIEDEPVWDINTLANSKTVIATSLLGSNSDLALMMNGVEV